jgi:hypothetical protein
MPGAISRIVITGRAHGDRRSVTGLGDHVGTVETDLARNGRAEKLIILCRQCGAGQQQQD